MQALKLTNLLKGYEDCWVALNSSRTKVLASGQTIKDILIKAKIQSSEQPIITYVSRFDSDYVG